MVDFLEYEASSTDGHEIRKEIHCDETLVKRT